MNKEKQFKAVDKLIEKYNLGTTYCGISDLLILEVPDQLESTIEKELDKNNVIYDTDGYNKGYYYTIYDYIV